MKVARSYAALLLLVIPAIMFWTLFRTAGTAETQSSQKKGPANKVDISEKQKIYEEFSKYEETDSEKPYEKTIQKWLNGENLEEHISLRTGEKPTDDEPLNATADIELFDLNNDGSKELAVRSFCISTGNCGLKIYERTPRNYKTILTANQIQQIKIQPKSTNGYRDLELRTHNSSSSSYYQVFKFDGATYKRRLCRWEDYTFLDDKKVLHELEKPIVHRVKCGKYEYVN
jgi:hypothetical protein